MSPPRLTSWTYADTAAYLKANPLPADFLWRKNEPTKHLPLAQQPLAGVRPTYAVADYGKWLRETPYFPGLFELIHDLLFSHPGLPDVATLAAQLTQIRRERDGQQELL